MTTHKDSTTTVSFLGLGAMGYLMAAHLPQYFEHVLVWNRTTTSAEKHAREHGTRAVSLSEALQADIIFSCLPTSAEVEHIITLNKPKAGSVWVDCTSGVPASAKKISKLLSDNNSYFLDAPVSGQTIGAKEGTLTVMVGGDAQALLTATPAIKCFAGLIEHVGSSGSGFAVKAVNNTLLAANLWAASEGLSILKAHGVDLASALTCINASSGQSLASSNILPNRVLNREFPNTFALNLLAKDAGIAIDIQQEKRVPAPLLSQVESLCLAASNQHKIGSADFSELSKFLEMMTGIEIS